MFELIIIYIIVCLLWVSWIKFPPKDKILTIGPLALAAAPSVFKGVMGLFQKRKANRLKESKFIPTELRENQELAKAQAYSRRAPGTALAEENIRRNLATTIGAQSRMYGGDASKMVALTSGAGARADNAIRGVHAQGQAFAENAFARLAGANNAVAAQKRQNRDEFNRAKAQLLQSSNQNIFNAIGDAATLGLMGVAAGGGKGSKFAQGVLDFQNPFSATGGGAQGVPNEYNPELGTYFQSDVPEWRQRMAARKLMRQSRRGRRFGN